MTNQQNTIPRSAYPVRQKHRVSLLCFLLTLLLFCITVNATDTVGLEVITLPDVTDSLDVADVPDTATDILDVTGFPDITGDPDATDAVAVSSATGDAATPPSAFPDVSGTGYEQAVQVVSDYQIMNGMPDGSFQPHAPITRAEFAKVVTTLLRSRAVSAKQNNLTDFSDVPADHWATDYIAAVHAKGLMIGDGVGFNPESPLNYQETLTILVRCLEYEKWLDQDLEWPYSHVQKALDLGLLQDLPHDPYSLDLDFEVGIGLTRPVPRGDIATMIRRALEVPSPYYGKTLGIELLPEYSHRPENQLPLRELAKLEESVVFIQTYADPGRTIPLSTGSGVLFNNGMILTNTHVLGSAPRFGITYNYMDKNREFGVSTVLYADEKSDIAVLYSPDAISPSIKVGSSATLSKGDHIVTIGSPFGIDFRNTFTDGIVSGFVELSGQHFIQFTAPVSSGSSGGALINEYGELVGITSEKILDAENMNLAIPIDLVLAQLQDSSIFDLVRSWDLVNMLRYMELGGEQFRPDVVSFFHKEYDEMNLEISFYNRAESHAFAQTFLTDSTRFELDTILEQAHDLFSSARYDKHLVTIRTLDAVYQYRFRQNRRSELRNTFITEPDATTPPDYDAYGKELSKQYPAIIVGSHQYHVREVLLTTAPNNTHYLQLFFNLSLEDFTAFEKMRKDKEFEQQLVTLLLSIGKDVQLTYPDKEVELVLWHHDVFEKLPESFEPDFVDFSMEDRTLYAFKAAYSLSSIIDDDYTAEWLIP